MKRRALLAGAVGAALVGAKRAQSAEVKMRPPGALAEADFQSSCIRCFRCAEVCPTQAIRFESSVHPELHQTPFIVPRLSACVLCMKCTEACPTGALTPIDPAPEQVAQKVRMGTPELTRSKCLSWNGEGLCRLCYYVCPYPDQAVELVGPQAAPLFHPEACVGCGLCEEACPDRAQAIHIRPREDPHG